MERIPVTVLTGFLGSGKTTLLNRILSENHGKRIAVIENEFGEIGIDQALVINADEEVFEMNNGCICCTVRGDLIRILSNLMKRRDKFDHILVETTGLADPSPVAQTFFVDDDMKDMFVLDGIVTLVDAKHVQLHLEDSNECREQIAFADLLILNKSDLVSEPELATLEARVRAMNALAKVVRASHADVSIPAVLDLGGFDLDRAVTVKPGFLTPEYPFEWAGTFQLSEGIYELIGSCGPDPTMDVRVEPLAERERAHEHEVANRVQRGWTAHTTGAQPSHELTCGAATTYRLSLDGPGAKAFRVRVPQAGMVGLYTQHLPSEFGLELRLRGERVEPIAEQQFEAGHTHDEQVSSVAIHAEGAVDPQRLDNWLSGLLRDKGTDIFRMKGILNVADNEHRFVFQGVHMLLDGRQDRPWGDDHRSNDLVFIGRNLDRDALTRGFEACLT